MSRFVPFLAFEASAGSGKTFNLVVRYLSLLFMGEDPRRIVALTFTNKAAAAMMERIVHTLNDLEHRGELAVISEVSGISQEEILRRREGVLKRFLATDVQIATIDKFFGSILRKFALNAGIMPTFSPVQQHHDVKLLERFLNEVEVRGQTQSLIRLSLLSNKRLGDLFSLLETLYGKHKEFEALRFEPTNMTTNPIARAMEAMEGLKVLVQSKGLSPTANQAMEVGSYEELIEKTWVYKESLDYWVFKKGFDPRMDSYLHTIQEAIKEQMNHKETTFFYELFTLLNLYIKSRNALIKESNELTFDDITLMVHSLLRGELDSEFLYFRLDARLKHLLLDEFQDTSTLQFDILRPLIEEIHAGEGVKEGGSFFFVGDVKQSIYRFRGGVSALFYQVANHFGVHVEPLRVNYRSRYEIVHFVNRVFSEKIRGYVHQEVSEKQRGGYARVTMSEEPLATVAERVQLLVAEGIGMDEIAILCATNADGSEIEEYLTHLGYDVVTETTARLISQRYVRALIEYLRYCYFKEAIYRHNCAALIGVDPQKIEAEEITDLLGQSASFCRRWEIVDKSVLVFLERLGEYRDIEEVVFTVERMEAASPQSDLKGIRVMTVHKSKGLEFEHVIVMDKLGMNRNRSEAIVFDYQGVNLERLFYRIKGREALDPDYARALEKDQVLAQEDQMNALYVALTRAIKSLHLVSKSKNSWFSPLDLSEGAWGVLESSENVFTPSAPLKRFDFQALAFGSQEEVMAQEKDESYDYEAVQFGSALHYTLEMMGEFSSESLEKALVSTRNRYGVNISEEKMVHIQQRIERLMDDSDFRRLTRGECFKEQSIHFGGKLHVMDLLVRQDDQWIIIDYKSGYGIKEKHEEQVRRYMQAVKTVSGEGAEGYIAYLLDEKIEWVKCL